MMRGLEPLVAEHPFARGMSASQLALLAGCAANRRYRAGDFIFRHGEEATGFYLIRSGKVAIELSLPSKGPLPLQTIGSGEVLGWAWITPPYVHRFDARAREDTAVLALDGVCLRGKLEQDHELGYELLRRFVGVLAERVESARVRLLDLYGDQPKGR